MMKNISGALAILIASAFSSGCSRQSSAAAAICPINIHDYAKDAEAVASCIMQKFRPGSKQEDLEKYLTESSFKKKSPQYFELQVDEKGHHDISVSFKIDPSGIIQWIGASGR